MFCWNSQRRGEKGCVRGNSYLKKRVAENSFTVMKDIHLQTEEDKSQARYMKRNPHLDASYQKGRKQRLKKILKAARVKRSSKHQKLEL